MCAAMINFTIFDGFQFHLELCSRINVSKIVGDDPWAPRNSIGTFVDRLLLTDAGLLGYIHGCILTKCLNPNLLFVESVNLSDIWYWYICYKWNTFGEIGVSKYTKPKERLRFESGFLKVNQWSLFRCLLFWHFIDSTWRSISFMPGHV